MKKIFTAMCALLVAFTATLLTSCGDDNENGKVEPQVVAFSCEPNDALLAIAKLTVSYTDENGDTKTVPLTGPFSKRITIKKFPMSGSFKVRATLKEYTGSGTTPTLSYCYEHSIFKQENEISSIGKIYTQTEVDNIIEKINKTSWEWSFLSDGTSVK